MIFSVFWLPTEQEYLWADNPVNAYLIYDQYQYELIKKKKVNKSFKNWMHAKDQLPLADKNSFINVTHLTYEAGLRNYSISVPKDTLLAVELRYSRFQKMKNLPYPLNKEIKIKTKDGPDFNQYKIGFEKIYEHLLNGDCYQVNYTKNYHFEMNHSFLDLVSSFFSQKNKLSAYAHATSLGENWGILSNSPECLVQKEKKYLACYPIKGTMKFNSGNQTELWNHLKRSKKQRAELIMIADLIRNDLSKIGEPNANIVLPFPRKLIVPGLMHQLAKIQTTLPKNVKEGELIRAIFPGGSITGAPKLSVMKIIQEIENEQRRFYCGSTILKINSLWKSSINIRTAEYKNNSLLVGAGGGITLKSTVKNEWNEMENKLKSFLSLFNVSI